MTTYYFGKSRQRLSILNLPHTEAMAVLAINRSQLVQRGRILEYFTVAYNALEGLVSIIAGLIAGSVSLVGFGLDSLIEVTSGAALLWRFHHDLNESRREAVEQITLRIVGWCFIALAVYVAVDSGWTLFQQEKPSWHHCRRRIGRGHASIGESKATGGRRNWERRNEGGFEADGLL
jgi:hypothetical protein